jgi:hypothetical protein
MERIATMIEDLRKDLSRSPECPGPEELLTALDRAPEDPERLRVEVHARDCASCQTEIALFRDFMSAEVKPEERAAVRAIVADLKRARKPQVESWWRRFLQPAWGGGAALALAALIFAVGLSVEWNTRHHAEHHSTDGDVLRSTMIHVTSTSGDVDRLPDEIAWEAVPAASSYAVTLSEVDGTQIFYSTVTTSPLLLPASVHKLVTAGKTVNLRVIARDNKGVEIASSGTQKLHLKPQPR